MAVISADMKRVVEEQRLGFVATVCPDGTPSADSQQPIANSYSGFIPAAFTTFAHFTASARM